MKGRAERSVNEEECHLRAGGARWGFYFAGAYRGAKGNACGHAKARRRTRRANRKRGYGSAAGGCAEGEAPRGARIKAGLKVRG